MVMLFGSAIKDYAHAHDIDLIVVLENKDIKEVNDITKLVAEELKENTNISINAVCPGWVKTDMGGSKAPKSVTEGADTIVWLALMDNPPTGGFFRDRQKIEW